MHSLGKEVWHIYISLYLFKKIKTLEIGQMIQKLISPRSKYMLGKKL